MAEYTKAVFTDADGHETEVQAVVSWTLGNGGSRDWQGALYWAGGISDALASEGVLAWAGKSARVSLLQDFNGSGWRARIVHITREGTDG